MPATVRYDEQYCPIARALDELGDRWTLLILRELMIADQRFTDLRRHLPGIAPTMLTHRLRTLSGQGLIATAELPPPAARTVYTLTEKGRGVAPVLRALTRWGMPLLAAPDDSTVVRPWTAVNAAVSTFFDERAAAGIDQRYLLVVDGQEFTLSSVPGGGLPRAEADVVITVAATVLMEIRQRRSTVTKAKRDGVLTASGDEQALADFCRIFQLD